MRTVLKATCGKHSKEIPLEQITHFIAEDKYVIAYYREGFLVLSDALKTLESEFSAEFIRTHRKALVRRSLISRFKLRPDDILLFARSVRQIAINQAQGAEGVLVYPEVGDGSQGEDQA